MSARRPPKSLPINPTLIRNWLSYLGLIIFATSFLSGAWLMLLDFSVGFKSPYLGILTYLLVPSLIGTGLLFILVGMVLERRRRRKMSAVVPPLPAIDFNLPSNQRRFFITLLVAVVFLLLSISGSYRAYQYTESVEFCGLVCHSVMKPQNTTYYNSPHARVLCTDCHIGPGATWYVRSKLSGAYQVYATAAKMYPRPIRTPIKNLRPARETCEQCHWPQKFLGYVERVRTYYLADKTNTPYTIRMLLKVGGADPSHGPVGGIHWHMSIANKIEFKALDEAQQVIPWVRITDRHGRSNIYQSPSAPSLTNEKIQVVDCITCHNRPAHIFRSPHEALDTALLLGRIDTRIPYIKKNASIILSEAYA
ncbi:MAG: NapC/NirT family cytochrome c, partial [Deltaproteobacteria bacterium]|nr:NapC/NirT family cytochrome c [Deltaproteobacteria bacterium]